MKHMPRIFGIILAVIVLLAFLLIFHTWGYDDSALKYFAKQLQEIDMIEDTQIVESQAFSGKLYGTNGEHYDFLACILIESEKTLVELDAYYGNMVFQPVSTRPKKYGEHKVKVEVIKMDDSALSFSMLEHKSIVFESLKETRRF